MSREIGLHIANSARRLPTLLCGVVANLGVALAAGESASHEWYSDLTDQRGRNCCNVADCAPVAPEDYRYTDRGLGIRRDGDWWPVPPGAWVGVEPPDGLPHACKVRSENYIRCVIWPGRV